MMLILLGHFVRFGHFVPLDILSHQAFCPFRHFVSLGIMSFGHFILLGILSYLDKMSFGHFIHGHFVIRGHFVTLGISSYNQNFIPDGESQLQLFKFNPLIIITTRTKKLEKNYSYLCLMQFFFIERFTKVWISRTWWWPTAVSNKNRAI